MIAEEHRQARSTSVKLYYTDALYASEPLESQQAQIVVKYANSYITATNKLAEDCL